MAAAALRFHPPHLLFPQQTASPSLSCRESLPRSRRLIVYSSEPHPQEPANEGAKVRAEISPSVLRALQPQNVSSSPAPSGESLIERNMRKRAIAQQASSSSPSIEESSSASSLGDGKLSDLNTLSGKQGSPASIITGEASLPPDKRAFPAAGDDEGFSRCAISASFPITAAFWQEIPLGFDIGEYCNLDYYAWYFRFFLLVCAIAEDPDYVEGPSAPSLLWLLLPSKVFPEAVEDLSLQWKKGVPGNFVKVLDNKDALSSAIECYSRLWSSEAWTERAKSGKASEFVLVLAYSAYLYILSGIAGDSLNTRKKLEDCSVLLNQSLTQLHGPPLDPIAIWEKALRGTSFALDRRAFVCNHAVIFPCKLKHKERQAQFGPMLEEVQNCVNKEFKNSDLVVFLQRSSDTQDEFFILIAPWYWALNVDSKQVAPVPAFLCMLSCIATSQFARAGADFGFCWEQYVVPLGWASILASSFFMNNMRLPTLCPFPSLGAIGKFSSDYGLVSSRSSLVSAVLKNSCAPLAVSLLLLGCGFTFWGPSHYNMANVVDFRGYVLVPPDLFSYSGILTKLLQITSVATIQGDDGAAKLAASPIVLAGLLGLNLTAFTLFPGLRTDGGYLLRSVLKSKKLANQLNSALLVLLTFILCAKSPFLGLGWLTVSYLTEPDCFVKDDVSDPDLLQRVAGAVLVLASLTCFIPPVQ